MQKQVGVLNIDGYYDCLLRFFDKGVEEGFIKPSDRSIIISAKTARELIQKMEVMRFQLLATTTVIILETPINILVTLNRYL